MIHTHAHTHTHREPSLWTCGTVKLPLHTSSLVSLTALTPRAATSTPPWSPLESKTITIIAVNYFYSKYLYPVMFRLGRQFSRYEYLPSSNRYTHWSNILCRSTIWPAILKLQPTSTSALMSWWSKVHDTFVHPTATLYRTAIVRL